MIEKETNKVDANKNLKKIQLNNATLYFYEYEASQWQYF